MNRIAELRKERGLSQQDLANALHVHQTSISQWETGKTNPDFGSICDLCAFFNVRFEYLTGRDSTRGHFGLTDKEADTLAADIVQSDIHDIKQRTLEYIDKMDYYGCEKVLAYAADISGNPKYQRKPEETEE